MINELKEAALQIRLELRPEIILTDFEKAM